MLLLATGLAIFIAIHLVPANPPLRRGLVARFGAGPYKIAFSLIAAAGLALIILGYAGAKHIPLWSPPHWTRHLMMALMLPVFPLLVMANLPGRLSAAIRHPMLFAVKLWALSHLLVRGDARSLLLFGALLAWAIFDRISVRRREAAGLVTIRSGPAINDLIAISVGLAIYGAFVVWGHAWLIGVPLLPR